VSDVADAPGRYEIVHGREAPPEALEGVVALDEIALDALYRVSAEDDRALFLSNRENGLVVREKATGRVVGYSMMLPVTDETYDLIRLGGFVDTGLSSDMVVRYARPGDYNLYLASMAVHPSHRRGLALRLLDAMAQDLVDLAGRGIYIRRLLADVVSADGERFCRSLGFGEVCSTDHRSKIYESVGLPLRLRRVTATTKRLVDAYGTRLTRDLSFC